MNTIEDFKNAPVGATATHALASRAMKTNNGDGGWVTPSGNYFSDEGMVNWGYTLDRPAPTTAREALDLAWELAHEVKSGQHIPEGTHLLDHPDHDNLSAYATLVGFTITARESLSIRTLEPLPDPEPDWLDAPAVLAATSMCPEQKVWIPESGGVWKCSCCRDELHWYELVDVTPLYPKGD